MHSGELLHLKNTFNVKTAHAISRFVVAHYFVGARKIRRILSKLLMPAPRGAVVVDTQHGFKIIVDPVGGKDLESSIYYFGTYEPGTLHVMQKCLKEGDVFFDIGSNIGIMSLFASQLVGKQGKIFAFEPDPDTFAILQDNLNLNENDRVQPQNLALGDSNGTASLFQNISVNRGASSLISSQENSNIVTVNTERPDDFILRNELGNIKLLKIDVEGWEFEVLKGAKQLLSKEDGPIVIFECSDNVSVPRGKIYQTYQYILSVNNYQVFKLKHGKEVISKLIRVKSEKELPHHDNLFCFLPTHLEYIPREIFEF